MDANTNTNRGALTASCSTKGSGGDEAVLLGQLQAGHAMAYEMLVRQHGGRMLATARRFFPSEHDAADAVQDAFIAAFKAIQTFKGESQLGTWLHRIVVNSCLMRRRSQDRHPTVAIESLLPQFDGTGHHVQRVQVFHDSPSDALTIDETRKQVRDCIERLPAPYREVLILRDIEEFDTEMTARMLDVSVGVVKTRLHRARQALRTLLKPVLQYVSL
jgi:RNA polymerase sigma-70 factor (ECF subfamily)